MQQRQFCAFRTSVRGGVQPLIANAESYGEEQQYGDYLCYQTVDEDEDGTYDYVEITDCVYSATEIVIPSEIEGLPVTSIGDYAFSWCESLESIEIPNSVTSIGDSAFEFCESLESIEIPNSVTSIGYSTFYGCESLESIEIPDSVTSIGDWAFYWTPWLENKRMENPLVIVNNILIDGETCEGNVIIPDGVISIRTSAFYYCFSLENIEIPDSVTNIGDKTFKQCSFESIEVSEDNNYYSSIDGALFNKEQTELITYPRVKTGTSYTIPNSVKSIGDYAFRCCTSLESIEIPDSVTSIGDSAFSYCTSLESIEIPDSVTSIEYHAFCECTNLTSITIENPDCEICDYNSTICNSGYYPPTYFNGVICGYENSTAYDYAMKYYYKFKLIGDEYLLGDANEDGDINVRDASTIARLLSEGRKDELPETADYNSDGEINVRDASMIARFLANKKS